MLKRFPIVYTPYKYRGRAPLSAGADAYSVRQSTKGEYFRFSDKL